MPTAVTITPATIRRITGTSPEEPPPDDPESSELAGTAAAWSFFCFLSCDLARFGWGGLAEADEDVVVVDPVELSLLAADAPGDL
jgi:hypothetical protein